PGAIIAPVLYGTRTSLSAASPLDRDVAPLFLRVVEAGALAAARWMGQGDNDAADHAAVEAIRAAFADLPIHAKIVIGEGERDVGDLTVVILNRPRHQGLIEQVRKAGARIKLIEDGDLAAAISVAVAGTGDHVVMGTGGAPEGVLAAAALRCLGGEILGRFVP